MSQGNLQASLKEIRYLLSHLHGEITSLEDCHSQVLLALKSFEGACPMDDLTGLFRPREFFRKWEALLEECRRVGDRHGIILIDSDVDLALNNRRAAGAPNRPMGDEALRRVTSLLKQYQSSGAAPVATRRCGSGS